MSAECCNTAFPHFVRIRSKIGSLTILSRIPITSKRGWSGCKTPINTAHTKATPSRFSAGSNANPPFEILYLSESLQVAQFEIGALAGDPLVVGGILNAPDSFAAVHVKVVLQRVADLTVVSEQDLIETTAQELTGDWRGYQHRAAPRSSIQEPVGTAPTQIDWLQLEFPSPSGGCLATSLRVIGGN
jgi:hypothetical protein